MDAIENLGRRCGRGRSRGCDSECGNKPVEDVNMKGRKVENVIMDLVETMTKDGIKDEIREVVDD